MRAGKCKICGKYEIREKEMEKKSLLSDLYPDLKIPVIRHWKWCKLNNNWCRNVAGNCGEIINKSENKLEGDVNEIYRDL